MAAILLIEDDLTFTRILDAFLGKHGHRLISCTKGRDGLRALEERAFDMVLLDYRLPDASGMDLLLEIKQLQPALPVVIMTSFNDLRTAVKAIKAGAQEYVTKPVNPEELLMIISEGLRRSKDSPAVVEDLKMDQYVEGKSPDALQLREFVRLVAPTNMSVIIEGESGTGKENVARSIHSQSKRSKGPFVAVDCGALSKELAGSELFGHVKGAFTGAVADKVGQFEAAHKGTIFLDEVGNLTYDVQIKLLRAIQERIIQPIGSTKEVRVDVRIITATNDDLEESVRKGTFREDLYHRLNEFKIHVPALRNRGEDLFLFMNFFRESANKELDKNVTGFSPEVTDLFQRYDWPGNLREMKNVIKRSILLARADVVHVRDLPPDMLELVQGNSRAKSAPVYDLKALQEAQEREMIMKTLNEVRYNKSKAARILNIDRKTLYLKMEKYGIQ